LLERGEEDLSDIAPANLITVALPNGGVLPNGSLRGDKSAQVFTSENSKQTTN
jgi:hypothetical protein